MRQEKPQADKSDAAKKRPEALREERQPGPPEGESKQPYASEVNDYQGAKVKPPKESPTTADG